MSEYICRVFRERIYLSLDSKPWISNNSNLCNKWASNIYELPENFCTRQQVRPLTYANVAVRWTPMDTNRNLTCTLQSRP